MVDTSDIEGLDPFDLLDAESDRVGRFFENLDGDEWSVPTRCDGWTRRDMLGHLAGVEVYHTACLDDDLQALFATGAENDATDMDSFNDWLIRERADRSAEEVLAEWRRSNAEVRRRLRERGAEGTMASSVGPYPVDLMAFHIASEYATHADDMGVDIPKSEHDDRLEWRVKVSRFGLKEAEKPVEISTVNGGLRVKAGDTEAELSPHDFVEAVTARLPDDHPIPDGLREALRALA